MGLPNLLVPLLFLLPFLRRRRFFCFFVPELVPSAMNEYIFQRRLADAQRLNFSWEGFDHVGDEAMSIFDFEAHLLVHNGSIEAKLIANLIGQRLRIAGFQQNYVAADFAR